MTQIELDRAVIEILPFDQQQSIAERTLQELEAARTWKNPIVTEVQSASTFYRAEDYHQEYFRNNAEQPCCAYVVAPKVRKFHEKFAGKSRARAPR